MSTDTGVEIFNTHEAMEQLKGVLVFEYQTRNELVPKISRLDADITDTGQWWSTLDPLYEGQDFMNAAVSMNIGSDPDLARDIIEYQDDIDVCTLKAGIITASHLFFGVNPIELSEQTGLRTPNDKTDMRKVVTLIKETISKINYIHIESLSELELVQELTQYSSQIFRERVAANTVQIQGFRQDEAISLIDDILEISQIANYKIASLVNIDEQGDRSKDKINLDIARLAGLRAKIRANTYYEASSCPAYEGHTPDITVEARRQQLASLISDLRLLFDNPNSTMWQRLRENHIKGSLHEALWYLDTVILRHVLPSRYGDLTVWQATQSANRPTIGKPEWNRAYDFAINNHGDVHYFQLKSSPQRNKTHNKIYHPAIIQLQEENFMELNPSRLRAKLNAYMRIVENDFSAENTTETLDKYLMPTAIEAMEIGRADVESRQSQIKRILKEHYLPGMPRAVEKPRLNRAQRRALKKKR